MSKSWTPLTSYKKPTPEKKPLQMNNRNYWNWKLTSICRRWMLSLRLCKVLYKVRWDRTTTKQRTIFWLTFAFLFGPNICEGLSSNSNTFCSNVSTRKSWSKTTSTTVKSSISREESSWKVFECSISSSTTTRNQTFSFKRGSTSNLWNLWRKSKSSKRVRRVPNFVWRRYGNFETNTWTVASIIPKTNFSHSASPAPMSSSKIPSPRWRANIAHRDEIFPKHCEPSNVRKVE